MATGDLTSTEQRKLAMIQLLDAGTLRNLLGGVGGPGTDAQRYLAMGGDAASLYQDIMDNLSTNDWQTVSTAAQAKFDQGDYNIDYDTFEGIKKAALDDYAKQKQGPDIQEMTSILGSFGVPELALIADKINTPLMQVSNPNEGWAEPIQKKALYNSKFNPERINTVLEKYQKELESMPKMLRNTTGSSVSLGDMSQPAQQYLNKSNDLVKKINELTKLKDAQSIQDLRSNAWQQGFNSVMEKNNVTPFTQYDLLRAQLAKSLIR